MTTITIVTPCRNAADRLRDTLVSLHAQHAVAAGKCRLEHIVVDGASTDRTGSVVGEFPETIYTSEPDRGMYDALAKGLQRASGSIVGYLNAGDILFPRAFDVLLEIFRKPGVHWATGYSTLINSLGQVTATWKPPRYRREFVLNGFYASPRYPHGIQQESTFWSSELNSRIDFKKLPEFRLAGDYFLWTQFARTAELHSVMTQLGAFLVHEGQLSEHMKDYTAEAGLCLREPSAKEKFTAWWETRCNTALRGSFWKFTLGQSPARIYDFNHRTQMWEAK
ncbi:MAG: glycosyltransferase [Terrimicrobiaceae bacterium]